MCLSLRSKTPFAGWIEGFLVTHVIRPYIIPCTTPFKELRLEFIRNEVELSWRMFSSSHIQTHNEHAEKKLSQDLVAVRV